MLLDEAGLPSAVLEVEVWEGLMLNTVLPDITVRATVPVGTTLVVKVKVTEPDVEMMIDSDSGTASGTPPV